ncbi:MAG: GNAT family N-acetyltransferase [Rhodospirillaceae bacterium]|nr:GNAT family N-acetyltransferase [Rhodospirillaceae bacterium]
MTSSRRWELASLDSKLHDRGSFACADAPELERYLKERATQDIKRNVARVFVAMRPEAPGIEGYYSLSACSFLRDQLPSADAKKLPSYPVPAALIGRLAVHDRCRGQGLGSFLLVDALSRVHAASHALAVHAVVVDARDHAAALFYRHFGFQPFPETPLRHFLPLSTVESLVTTNPR